MRERLKRGRQKKTTGTKRMPPTRHRLVCLPILLLHSQLPPFLRRSSQLLLCKCLVQHLASSIKTLCTFWSHFEILDPDAARVAVGLSSLTRPGHPAVVPKASISALLISLPLQLELPRTVLVVWQRGNFVSRATFHQRFSTGLRSDHIVDGFFVPPVLLFQPPHLTRSGYTFCRRHEALSTVVSLSQPHGSEKSCVQDDRLTKPCVQTDGWNKSCVQDDGFKKIVCTR